MPTGISVGANTIRPRTSAAGIMAAPHSAAAGITAAPCTPVSRRAISGATNATNATGPAAATPTAASPAPTATRASRVRSTWTPRLRAVSSPRASASSERVSTAAIGTRTASPAARGQKSLHARRFTLPTSHV